jgi:hypothetical protein
MIAVATPLTEAEWLNTTCSMLDGNSWSRIHHTPTRRAETVYTEGSTGSGAAGWPDLFAVRGERAIALELKREGNRPSHEQIGWLDRLRATGIEAHVVTLPYDYGFLEDLLRPDPEQLTFTTGNSTSADWLPQAKGMER